MTQSGGGGENTSSSVTLYNFQKRPSPSAGPEILDCSVNQERILKFYSYSGIDGKGSIEHTLSRRCCERESK